MNVRKSVESTASTVTLYGDRFDKLEKLCFENKISSTAFYNTIIEAFATGALKIENGNTTRRRVSGQTAEDVLDQLRYTITDKDGNKLF